MLTDDNATTQRHDAITAMVGDNLSREKLRDRVSASVYESMARLIGGGLYLDINETEQEQNNDASWLTELKMVAQSSVSFPNKDSVSLDGKPHDIEVRAALVLFHRCIASGRKRKLFGTMTKTKRLSAISDLGVRRTADTPQRLATLLCSALEELMKQEHLSYDVRSSSSGIICIVTPKRAQALRASGRLPCAKCVQWCKGEKGLWWHEQREHGSEHSVAVASAALQDSILAIVPYVSQQPMFSEQHSLFDEPPPRSFRSKDDTAFDLVKNGELGAFKEMIKDGYDPRESTDKNGASLLLWAAGSGALEIVKYMIETCECSPNVAQKGKRSFAGRTALHWASRNGHIDVVRYLVETCHVDMDTTTNDGTTAFCWAAWKAHLPVMSFLHKSGADIQRANSFGCNAVLWCAQGDGIPETMEWLHSIGVSLCDTNSNGHGALHKAAQRRRGDLCEWLCTSVYEKLKYKKGKSGCARYFNLIGPDSDGCCPSDLAGMEGDDKLALFLAEKEQQLANLWYAHLVTTEIGVDLRRCDRLPAWFQKEVCLSSHGASRKEDFDTWEPWGGVRRLQFRLRHGLNNSQSH